MAQNDDRKDMTMAHEAQATRPWQGRMIVVATIATAEVLILAITYQFFATLDCHDTGAYESCRYLRSLVARAIAILAVAVVLVWARPGAFARFAAATRDASQQSSAVSQRWAALHLAGLGLLFLPIIVLGGRDMAGYFAEIVLLWLAGGVLAALGMVLVLAPPKAWRQLLGELRWLLPGALAIGYLIPDLAMQVLPLWDVQGLTTLTFVLVHGLLSLFSDNTSADIASYVIGLEGFYVQIARQCSGVEGVALVFGFTLLYALLFRQSIDPLRFWLVVLPLGIVASWTLNIVRIALLILLGAHVSPQLAVDGFHSYAGWLFFTLLALGLIYGVQATPWLHRDSVAGKAASPLPPLRKDWDAARILPFVAFMLSGVIVAALVPVPELGYPLKVLAMAGALACFWPLYRKLDWRLDPFALGAGVVIGIVWITVQPEGSATGREIAEVLGGLSMAWLVAWIAVRMIGTILLVPLVEELFFRGYVLARLDRGGMAWRILALAVSSGLFALLHGRWLMAGLAGVVLGLVMLRRGRVGDAVLCHASANAVIAAVALAKADWGLI
ncbi:MAG: exosortase E/protease, VPEID-CTERM system [Pararhodobacter sp.]